MHSIPALIDHSPSVFHSPTRLTSLQIPYRTGSRYQKAMELRGVVIGGGDSKLCVSVDVDAIAKSRQA